MASGAERTSCRAVRRTRAGSMCGVRRDERQRRAWSSIDCRRRTVVDRARRTSNPRRSSHCPIQAGAARESGSVRRLNRWRVRERKDPRFLRVRCRMCVRCAPISADGCSALLDEWCRILCVGRPRTSEVNDEAEPAALSACKTGAFGAEIYFRAQVFHRFCTPHRHLFHTFQ
jgi:hypothetical protein